ncbi:MAG: stage V sporulation T C-terminal domain-containing protein [Bacilli bacterium]|nr:stage V sporulation T C-terminal domain-containing protein [Bacilli bacterium]MDD4053289.1 stage V sporulation T C-terminal domain-containing protein [Bacilli bacterium]MDD4411370.1 stage V sporulation T C-terminal domain-containing protein [Bacilli bacterium]
MKTTGISRRIDDLGRIVIPKEIRKNLKIRDGELLEIFIEGEQIILTKHSPMKSIEDIAKLCVAAINDAINISIIITDRDKVIAASPHLSKKYLDKDLNIELSELMLRHNPVIEREPKALKIDNNNEEITTYVSYPIIADGDVAGLVIILGGNTKINDNDNKIADIISKILSRNIT